LRALSFHITLNANRGAIPTGKAKTFLTSIFWGGQTVANQQDEHHNLPEGFDGFLGAKLLSGCRKKKGSAFAPPFSNLVRITAREFN